MGSETVTQIGEIALIFHQISGYLHLVLSKFNTHVSTTRFKLHTQLADWGWYSGKGGSTEAPVKEFCLDVGEEADYTCVQ